MEKQNSRVLHKVKCPCHIRQPSSNIQEVRGLKHPEDFLFFVFLTDY